MLALVSLIPRRWRRLGFLLVVPLAGPTFARSHDWRSQESLFESALAVWPGSIQARLALAGVRLARGEVEAANQLYQEVLQATPRTDPRHLEVRFELGRQAFDRGDLSTAITQLRAVRSVAGRQGSSGACRAIAMSCSCWARRCASNRTWRRPARC
ncbi:MAG: tetratricopeptide repeat protein [Planctomycetota bacterium]